LRLCKSSFTGCLICLHLQASVDGRWLGFVNLEKLLQARKRPRRNQERFCRLLMATGNSASMTTQQTVDQIPPRGAPAPVITQAAIPPPSRRELASWWKKFRKTTEKEDEKRGCSIPPNTFPLQHPPVFVVRMASTPGAAMHSLLFFPIPVAMCWNCPLSTIHANNH
jgi:hypothetical protein